MADRVLVPKDQPSQHSSTSEGKNYLLAIAINDYEQCTKLSNAVLDVEVFIEVLSTRYLFSTQNTIFIKNDQATKKRIENEFLKLIKLVKPQDNLIIYFSGHGRHDEHFGGNWVPVEAGVTEEDWPDYLSNDQIKGYLSRINSRHTFLIADSCFSGAFVQDASRNLAGRVDTDPSRWVLTSGKSEIVSDGRPGQHSPFAKVLLEELRKAKTHLGVMELCAAVQLKVASNSVQTPVGAQLSISGNLGGQMVLYLREEERKTSENEIWSKVDQHDSKALLTFIHDNPKSPFLNSAITLLNNLLEMQKFSAFVKPEMKVSSMIVPEHMVLIKGRNFEMGDVMGDKDNKDEIVHNVTLSDFFMAKYQLTFDEYDAFCRDTGKDLPNDAGWGRDKRPVINVNWFDALDYCNWLSKQEGLTPIYKFEEEMNAYEKNNLIVDWKANGYRLPTEAEWEYAARGGGEKTRFGNGKNVADSIEINFNCSKEYKYSIVDEFRGKTIPVGSLNSPNILGLHDMSGNVWEWCWDWYVDYYYRNSPVFNPIGPNWGHGRVARGGSWYSHPNVCRVSRRVGFSPDLRGKVAGFRVVRRINGQ